MRVRVQYQCACGRWRVWTSNFFLLLGLGCLLVWAWDYSEGALYQRIQQAEFAKTLRPAESSPAIAADETRPLSTPALDAEPILAGSPPAAPPRPHAMFDFLRPDPQLIGRLDIPEIKLSVMVREGVDDDTLRRAAGHLPSSVLPGQRGDFIVLAHRDTYFRPLRDIARGTKMVVRTHSGGFTYVVDSIEVTEPEGIRLEQGSEPSATLITCYPFTYIGPAPRRMVVHARLAGQQ